MAECDVSKHDDVIKYLPRYWPFVWEFTGNRWIPRTKASDLREDKGWVNNREADDWRHHRAHYDVTAMTWPILWGGNIIQEPVKAYKNNKENTKTVWIGFIHLSTELNLNHATYWLIS